MHRFPAFLPILTILCWPLSLWSDGPADNRPDQVRQIPPIGIDLSIKEMEELTALRDRFFLELEAAKKNLANKPAQLELLPDVEVFYKGIDWALRYREFYDPKEVQYAREQVAIGLGRLRELVNGKLAPSWLTQTGLVVRGYRSRIDGSVQPYGLYIGSHCRLPSAQPYRVDLWCHGRGEKLTELGFLQQRLKSKGEFFSENHITLHLYGRYCNANKFAGEMDAFEALEHLNKHYPIDRNRLIMRGFSMGGAAAWQFAVHYPGRWCAAAPGAGFSETTEFLRIFQNEPTRPTPWEERLLHWYDCTDWALNLSNLPTIAYSGEDDKQKQAADIMEKAMYKWGLKLTHIIGPKTGHSYHPQAKAEINRRLDMIAARGREPVPHHLRFITYTLRYPSILWLHVDGLEKHWSPGRVDVRIMPPNRIVVQASQVTGLTFDFPSGHCPLQQGMTPIAVVAGKEIPLNPVESDRSWRASIHLSGGQWLPGQAPPALAKRPGLTGPIDDAFMDSFLFVKPTGKPLDEKAHAWVQRELEHAAVHWRRHFRGEVTIKRDVEVQPADHAKSHLVLWGDPSSNQVWAQAAKTMPITWNQSEIRVGDFRSDSRAKALVGIYPNILYPNKYLVFNSGFTFREYDHLNNARQIAKLPDWAVLDVTTPPSSRWPGKILRAGFFNESWNPGESWDGPGVPLPANR